MDNSRQVRERRLKMGASPLRRRGLRVRGQLVEREVRDAVVRFASWLRSWADFPIRVPVYLQPAATLVTRHGERVTASFFAPFDRSLEPYIRVATGDFAELRARRGRDSARGHAASRARWTRSVPSASGTGRAPWKIQSWCGGSRRKLVQWAHARASGLARWRALEL